MLIDVLAKLSGIAPERINFIASTADKRYKEYSIPKTSGGNRKIEHPSRELKAIQRWIVSSIFAKFPIHSSATAYKAGGGVRVNAELHRRTSYTSRYDFAGFFPSFSADRIAIFLREKSAKIGLEIQPSDVDFICRVVCRRGALVIGAPSSPYITNVMMFDFDYSLEKAISDRSIVYSRYADDLFFSSSEVDSLLGVQEEIRSSLNGISHLSLKLNMKKTVHLSRRYSRRVTGVVLTPDFKLSVGRSRKREIRTLIHLWKNGELSLEQVGYLRGLLAFALDIEPSLGGRLERKYGAEEIWTIVHSPTLEV